MKKKLKWIVAVIAVFTIIGATIGCGSDKENTAANAGTEGQQEEASQTEEVKTTFGVGETAEQNNIQVTLANAIESNGSEYIKPSEGNVFLLLEFEITNNSDKDISISSIMNFEAYCDDYSINQDILGLQAPEIEGKGQLDGSIAAGKKMNGVIAYQVPADYTNFEVSVSPDFWSGGAIQFVVNK